VVPYDLDVIWERQPRRTQRHLFEEACDLGEHDRRGPTAFIKKEPYGKVTHPRLITIAPTKNKIKYLRFVHAIVDTVFKKCKWYASGMVPREIAERVAWVCEHSASHVNLSDYSRFDGHVSPIIRLLQRTIYLQVLRPEYRNDMDELFRQSLSNRVTLWSTGPGTTPIAYDPGYSQLSGFADTSVNGSMASAFISFVAYRLMGRGVEESYKSLGIFLGDDGLTSDLPPPLYARAAKMVGQKLDHSIVRRGDRGVTFLARYYSANVWYGELDSCCDVRRQAMKFHTTPAAFNDLEPAVKLREKAISFYLTDRNTPIIGEFVTRVIELSGLTEEDIKTESETANGLRTWASRASFDSQYPNVNSDGWMEYEVELAMPDFHLESFRAHLQWARSVGDLLNFRNFGDPTPRLPPWDSVVDGEVVGNGEEAPALPELKIEPHARELDIAQQISDDEFDDLVHALNEAHLRPNDAQLARLEELLGAEAKHEPSVAQQMPAPPPPDQKPPEPDGNLEEGPEARPVQNERGLPPAADRKDSVPEGRHPHPVQPGQGDGRRRVNCPQEGPTREAKVGPPRQEGGRKQMGRRRQRRRRRGPARWERKAPRPARH
jgi:hypothetical protein